MGRLLGFVVALAAPSLQALGGASARTEARPISAIVFPGGFDRPIWVAQEKGFVGGNGVAVTLTPTPNSVRATAADGSRAQGERDGR